MTRYKNPRDIDKDENRYRHLLALDIGEEQQKQTPRKDLGGKSEEAPKLKANGPKYETYGNPFVGLRSWIAGLYKKKGFTPFALALIGIGAMVQPVLFLVMDVPKPGEIKFSWRAISLVSSWSIFIGGGYILFKILLIGVSKIAEAAKTGAAKAPPPAQDTTPPDDIETRLQRLEDLKEKSLLTDAEYQAKREEILGEV
jgi:hypothetical protein